MQMLMTNGQIRVPGEGLSLLFENNYGLGILLVTPLKVDWLPSSLDEPPYASESNSLVILSDIQPCLTLLMFL